MNVLLFLNPCVCGGGYGSWLQVACMDVCVLYVTMRVREYACVGEDIAAGASGSQVEVVK